MISKQLSINEIKELNVHNSAGCFLFLFGIIWAYVFAVRIFIKRQKDCGKSLAFGNKKFFFGVQTSTGD